MVNVLSSRDVSARGERCFTRFKIRKVSHLYLYAIHSSLGSFTHVITQSTS